MPRGITFRGRYSSNSGQTHHGGIHLNWHTRMARVKHAQNTDQLGIANKLHRVTPALEDRQVRLIPKVAN